MVAGHVGQHRELRVVERHVDPLPPTRLFATGERRENGDRRERPREEVRDRDADLHRLAAGLARDRHEPAHGLNQEVVSRLVRARARRPVARDRAEDDARVHGRERVVAEPEPVEVAGAEVLDDDVGPRREAPHRLAAGLGLEIERDRALVAIRRRVVGRGAVGQERRAPSARVVARARTLDLDDIGAQIAEHLGAERTRENAREVQNPEVREGARGHSREITTSRNGAPRRPLAKDSAIK